MNGFCKRRGPLHTRRRLTTARLDVRTRWWPPKLIVGNHDMRLSNPATHISTIFLWESSHFQARAKRRKNLTMADAICDCQIMQPTLPQCLIGNHVTFFFGTRNTCVAVSMSNERCSSALQACMEQILYVRWEKRLIRILIGLNQYRSCMQQRYTWAVSAFVWCLRDAVLMCVVCKSCIQRVQCCRHMAHCWAAAPYVMFATILNPFTILISGQGLNIHRIRESGN